MTISLKKDPPASSSSHDDLEKALTEAEQSAEKPAAAPAGTAAPAPAAGSALSLVKKTPEPAAPPPAAAQPPAQDKPAPAPAQAAEAPAEDEAGDEPETEYQAPPPAWQSSLKKVYDGLLIALDATFEFAKRYGKRVVITAVVVPVVYFASIFGYYTYLLQSAEQHLAQESYAAAADKLGRYLARYSEEIERGMVLVRLYGRIGKYREAEQSLTRFQRASGGALPAQRYEAYLGLIDLAQNNATLAQGHVKKSLDAGPNYLPGYYLQAAAHFYGEEQDMAAAIQALDQGIGWFEAEADDAQLNREDINFFREMLQSTQPSVLSEDLPLPFEALSEASLPEGGDTDLPRLPVSGFRNLYYVPTGQQALQEEDLASVENMRLLQAAAALRLDDTAEAERYLGLSGEAAETPSLYQRYIEGFFAAKQGNYEDSAAVYRALKQSDAGYDADMMLASSLWAANGGAAPTAEMTDLYGSDAAARSGSALATANLGYLNIYLGKWQEARMLLEEGAQLMPEDFHIVYNLALLNAMEGEFAATGDSLRALRDEFPESLTPAAALMAGRLLSQALFLQGDYRGAVGELNSLKKSHSLPGLYLAIADIYQSRSQPLLAASELTDGLQAFPENDSIRVRLLLEFAAQKNLERFEEIKKSTNVRFLRNDYRALLAEAILRQDAPAQAEPHFISALSAAQSEEQKELVLIEWARGLMVGRHYRQAGEVLARQTGAQLPALQILRIWAESISADDNRKKALATAAAQLKDPSPTGLEQIDLAYALVELGEYKQAEEHLLALSSVSDDSRVLQGLDRTYTASGDERRAQAVRERLRLRGQAAAEQETRQSQEYRDAIAKAKDSGLAFSASGQTGAGLEGSVAGTGAGREEVAALNEAVANQDYQTAVNIYGDFMKRENPPFTPAIMHQNRGVLYLKMENFQAAEADFEKALQFEGLKPEDRNSMLYNYSLALIKTEKLDQSTEVLKQMLAADPENLRGWVLYSQVLKKLRNFTQLVPVYEKILELSPGQVSIYLELAKIHRVEGNIDAALEMMNSALELSPRSKAIHRGLAELYSISGKPEKAQEHLDTIKGL